LLKAGAEFTMRLRYLYLPDYGPLKEVAVIFGRNEHIENRKGAINFVVGLNGSGKSCLLRAIYDVFHSLSLEELPKFPVTLAYNMEKRSQNYTTVFHRPRGPASDCFLVPTEDCPFCQSTDDWQGWVESKVATEGRQWSNYVPGDQLKGNGDLRNWLPSRVLAYTSGDLDPWQSMTYPIFPADEIVDAPGDFDKNQERPCGWTAEKEHLDGRITSVPDSPTRIKSVNATPFNERCILLSPGDIRLAAISLGIWKAALDLEDRPEDDKQDAFRIKCLDQIESKILQTGDDVARRLLNELDWLWPTHASFLLAREDALPHHAVDPVRCFWLHALADAVIRHPLDESLSVVTLGHRPPIRPETLAGEGTLEGPLKDGGEPMRNAHCGAEALRCLFAGEKSVEESLWSIFQALCSWRAFGLLKEAHLTVKRIRRVPDAEGRLDDCETSYENFSDGEQMLLGRMAILLLLRGQENSLLLLDEPETHFNDAWKRQIIDMVDDGILKATAVQVLVSTHTSLTLTDVFS
jgi:energy-coupling factor transporter ATP-binding protein EcfA2